MEEGSEAKELKLNNVPTVASSTYSYGICTSFCNESNKSFLFKTHTERNFCRAKGANEPTTNKFPLQNYFVRHNNISAGIE